jgi:hypothetical protein
MYANPLSLLQVKASIIRQKLKGRPTFDLVALTAHATGSRQPMQVSYELCSDPEIASHYGY